MASDESDVDHAGVDYADVAFETLDPRRVYRSTYRLAPEVVERYCAIAGVEPDGELAPPWVFCSFRPIYDALGGRFAQGSVHIRQQTRMSGRVRVGAELDVELTVAEKYVRNDRNYAVLEATFSADGAPRCVSRLTVLWGYAAA